MSTLLAENISDYKNPFVTCHEKNNIFTKRTIFSLIIRYIIKAETAETGEGDGSSIR